MEAYTYRMGAHTTTDDPTRYRLSCDVEHWKLKDPIQRVRVYLTRNGLVDQDFFDEIELEAEKLGEHLRGAPGAEILDIFDYVYAEEQPGLATQRDGFAAYLDSFDVSTGSTNVAGAH